VNRYVERVRRGVGGGCSDLNVNEPDYGIYVILFLSCFCFCFPFLYRILSRIATLFLFIKGWPAVNAGTALANEGLPIQLVLRNLGSPIQSGLINFGDKNLFLLSSITAPHSPDIYIHIYLYLYLYLSTLRPGLRSSVPRGPVQQQMTSYRRGEVRVDN
jgi:hypothetical protein